MLFCDFSRSLGEHVYKADGQEDFHASLKKFMLNYCESFQKLFLKDNHCFVCFNFLVANCTGKAACQKYFRFYTNFSLILSLSFFLL